jgi:hypothetical protein
MKRRIAPIALLSALFLSAALLAAEDSVPVKTFAWRPVDGAVSYELVIERANDAGAFVRYLSERTGATSHEIPLPAGSYRYQVTVYNNWGIGSEPTPWVGFDIDSPLPSPAPATVTTRPEHRGAFEVGLAYGPLIPLYGTINTGETLFPVNASLRAAFLPVDEEGWAMGIEVEPSLGVIHVTLGDEGYSGSLIRLSGGIFGRKYFADRQFALSLHGAGGVSFLAGFHFPPSASFNGGTPWYPHVGAGPSGEWFPSPRLMVTLGAQWVHLFLPEATSPGYLAMSIGASWTVK